MKNEFEEIILQPRYECDRTGVYFVDVVTDKDGTSSEKAPLRLSDCIELIGRGRDQDGSHYRIIEWRDYLTQQTRVIALPMAEIGANWQGLLKHGLTVHSGRRKRELLADYLQTNSLHTPYIVTQKCGWQGKAYTLPNGDIIRPDNQHAERIIYNGDTSQAHAYTVSGSLKDWQSQVAQYAAGNSRLLLALGTALAAPLLALVGEQNGGFHIYGDSSDGKTTAALVALSVFGNPQSLKMTWRGTDLGFSNAALSRNDGLLVLDEIGEAHPKTIRKTAYSVINGKSKIQGAKDGGNRAAQEWRILLFSTGEYSMNAYMNAAAEKWEAGQAVRLPSIPAATKYGIYENLHEFSDGATLSEHLQAATQSQHGAAGREWIKQLANTPTERVQAALNAFMTTLPSLDGQARRVAKRFALVAAALELASGITGLANGVGMTGVKQCFDDWLQLNGTGKQEDRQIIKQAVMFMQLHSGGERFASWNSEFTNREHAGYRKTSQVEPTEYWIIPNVFEDEILQGKDPRKGCAVLHGIGWLKKNPSGARWKIQRFDKGRFYVLVGEIPPDMPEDLD
ncbi:DUF927 domain-containing protein [Kingella kingae]|uniref:DUF927 domain-containing protein n=1 Tax=Kingella kingae TaxID=504 RepID=UPI0002D790D8|nr:DUF927 domain-containing protein [Kingella kingae]MDK4554609.1 DUF927 domain-containing protein [Kingella kingae]MDK4583658.1 DUF927 domain-containing protein [Kingella kingae]MDK4587574.1 DUF927 domain-containing protein [Kingella kingae]MDK4610822.1 DUF927 domain-containing protein [Kingella kingae]MDK4643199.1 DUF927 domain-containing protein [Kingella kingae]